MGAIEQHHVRAFARRVCIQIQAQSSRRNTSQRRRWPLVGERFSSCNVARASSPTEKTNEAKVGNFFDVGPKCPQSDSSSRSSFYDLCSPGPGMPRPRRSQAEAAAAAAELHNDNDYFPSSIRPIEWNSPPSSSSAPAASFAWPRAVSSSAGDKLQQVSRSYQF